MGPTLERAIARLAFAGVAALWLGGLVLLRGGAGEPYPGIMMPAFAGAAGYHGGEVTIDRMEAVFVSSTGSSVFTQRALFAPYPDSHHATLAGHLALPARDRPRPARAWLRHNLLPGLAAGRTDRRPECPSPSLRAWARTRAEAMLPGASVQRLEIRWYRDTFRPGSRRPVRRAPAGVVTIPLADGRCAR